MKYSIYLLLIFIVGCSVSKDNLNTRDYSKGIVYVLPGKVEFFLKSKLLDEEANIYFVLERLNTSDFRIYLGKISSESSLKTWIDHTNRYISVDGKLYPLIFDFDTCFANTETAEEFLLDQKAGIYKRTSIYVIREFVYHIDFTEKGDVLYEGI